MSMSSHVYGIKDPTEEYLKKLAVHTACRDAGIAIPESIEKFFNYETPDPDCDIDCVPNFARKRVVNIALKNGFAFGGNNATLVIKKYAR